VKRTAPLVVVASIMAALGAAVWLRSSEPPRSPTLGSASVSAASSKVPPRDGAPSLEPFADEKGHIGFLASNGTVVLAPRFDQATPFAEGFSAVRMGARWGYVNRGGTLAIEPRFDFADSFSEGRAVIGVGAGAARRFGFIDETGAVVVEPAYADARSVHDGLARVMEIGPPRADVYLDKNGKVAWKSPGSPSFDFHDGLARVQKEDKVGFVDKTGKWIISPRFDSAGDFREGLAPFSIDQRWGYVGRAGETVANHVYLEASAFTDGLGRVLTPEKVSFLDRTGRVVFAFETAGYSSEGLVPFMRQERWGFCDHKGAVVIEARFKKLEGGFAEGLAAVSDDTGRFGYIDRIGKFVIEPNYAFAAPFHSGIARVELEPASGERSRRIGYIDKKGGFLWGPVPLGVP
jgi:hypothetical protein